MRITREASRTLARRHLPTACLVSIVVVLQPMPVLTSAIAEPSPAHAVRTYELSARICLARGDCGALSARVTSPDRER